LFPFPVFASQKYIFAHSKSLPEMTIHFSRSGFYSTQAFTIMKIISIQRIFLLLSILPFASGVFVQLKAQDNLPVMNDAMANTVVVDFYAEDTVIYAGTAVKFHNQTTGGATFYRWKVNGGVPGTTYHSDPTIMFYTPGLYDVTLDAYAMGGNGTLTKENYIQVLEVESELPPGWEYNNTTSQQVIFIPFTSNPRIFDVPLDSGDFIGVFYYDMFSQLQCAGATQWTGTGTQTIVANGNNAFTPLKDGFYPGEIINWKIHSTEAGEDFPASVSWDDSFQMQEIFIPNAISGITDIYAGEVFELELKAGWSAISSPVQPWNPSLDALFGDFIGHLKIMSNHNGVFYPEGNQNTIGDWQNTGYFIKMDEDVTIQVKGYPVEQTTFPIEQGWNLIAVPVNCEVDVLGLVQAFSGKIEMVKEVAGLNSFIPEREIFTLETLQPGEAYLLMAAEPFALQFQPCFEH
jgi:PKD repeat protein